jgi:hypothetical protein
MELIFPFFRLFKARDRLLGIRDRLVGFRAGYTDARKVRLGRAFLSQSGLDERDWSTQSGDKTMHSREDVL